VARKKKGSLLGSLFGLLVTKPRAKAKATKVRDERSHAAARARGQKVLDREAKRYRQLQREKRVGEATADRKEALEKLAAERARTKAARERERQRALEERAERARLKSVERPSRAKAETAARRSDSLDELAARIERHELSGSEIRDLMASGRLNTKPRAL